MNFYTDYPIAELGDEPGTVAPIRQLAILSYDDNKYCQVKLVPSNIETEIKSGYIYTKKGRCGEVPVVTLKELSEYTN